MEKMPLIDVLIHNIVALALAPVVIPYVLYCFYKNEEVYKEVLEDIDVKS